jgi:hypothetical protein
VFLAQLEENRDTPQLSLTTARNPQVLIPFLNLNVYALLYDRSASLLTYDELFESLSHARENQHEKLS